MRSATGSGTTVRVEYLIVFSAAFGSRPPLLLQHGGNPGANGVSNFNRNIPSRAESLRVIVPDLPRWFRSNKRFSAQEFPALCSQSGNGRRARILQDMVRHAVTVRWSASGRPRTPRARQARAAIGWLTGICSFRPSGNLATLRAARRHRIDLNVILTKMSF